MTQAGLLSELGKCLTGLHLELPAARAALAAKCAANLLGEAGG